MKSKRLGAIIAGVIVIGGLIGGFSSIHRIPAGYVGVIYNMSGGVQQNVFSQGFHFASPTQHVTKYSIATEQAFLAKGVDTDGDKDSDKDNSFSIPTSDGKTVNVDLEFSYHFDSQKLPTTFTQFKGQDGKTIENTFIKSKMKSWAQEVSADYSVIDIYGSDRAKLNRAVLDHTKKNFAPYGIVIDSVNFSRISLDDQTAKAIQNRINAQQDLETAKVAKQKAEVEAQKAVIEAQGKAKVTEVGAKAEADANKLKQSTLNNTIVQYEAVKKWDGNLPKVSGSSANILDVSGLIK